MTRTTLDDVDKTPRDVSAVVMCLRGVSWCLSRKRPRVANRYFSVGALPRHLSRRSRSKNTDSTSSSPSINDTEPTWVWRTGLPALDADSAQTQASAGVVARAYPRGAQTPQSHASLPRCRPDRSFREWCVLLPGEGLTVVEWSCCETPRLHQSGGPHISC